MARALLNELQFRLLDRLVKDGPSGFAALFDAVHAATGAGAAEILAATLTLYDLSLVDVRSRDKAGSDKYLDRLEPQEFLRAYRDLDAFSAGVLRAKGAEGDPYVLSASQQGLAEHGRAAYEPFRAASDADGPGGLPTLPFE